MKRFFDIVSSLLLLAATWPLLLIGMLSVWMAMGAPVLFTQLRPGLHGQPFRLYKLRTMSDVRDFDGNLLPDEQRLGRIGTWLRRLSVDELPQLINVIKGDMSIIGPRPLLMEYLPLYNGEQVRRHEVSPGITGWAQVNGRNAISWEDKFKYDVWYVDHHSFRLDLKILWMTLIKVFCSEGVTQSGHVTMEKFRGSK